MSAARFYWRQPQGTRSLLKRFHLGSPGRSDNELCPTVAVTFFAPTVFSESGEPQQRHSAPGLQRYVERRIRYPPSSSSSALASFRSAVSKPSVNQS